MITTIIITIIINLLRTIDSLFSTLRLSAISEQLVLTCLWLSPLLGPHNRLFIVLDYQLLLDGRPLVPLEGHILKKLPLHSCGRKWVILVFCRQTLSLSIGRFFVSMSDPVSSVWIFTKENSPSSTLSHNKWYLLCMFLVGEWYEAFLARCMTLWLA